MSKLVLWYVQFLNLSVMFLEGFNHHHWFLWLKPIVIECYWIYWKSIAFNCLCHCDCWLIQKLSVAIVKMVAFLFFLVPDQHMSLRVNHKFFACLKIGETRILYVSFLLIVIFKAALTFIEVPKFFLCFFSEIEARILEILFVSWL